MSVFPPCSSQLLFQASSLRSFLPHGRQCFCPYAIKAGFKWEPLTKTFLESNVKMPEFYDGSTFKGPVPMDKIKKTYACSSGPGGQNVNKIASKVQLSFHVLSASWLPKWVRHRLVKVAKNSISKDGTLLVSCESQRTQSANLSEACSKLENIIKEACKLPKERSAETEQVILQSKHKENMHRLRSKKFQSAKKRERTEYK